MPELGPMQCRLCKSDLIPSLKTVAIQANSYCDCFYRCANCHVGYSNAQDEHSRTLIYDSWERNIPVEVHDGLLQCVGSALNKRNRTTKLKRLSFESSEDAVTWTVFRYLQDSAHLGKLFGVDRPRVLFWGREYPERPVTTTPDVTQILTTILLQIGDESSCLSEPDIVLVTDDSVCTIEVKYREDRNTVSRRHRRFREYTDAAPELFDDANVVADTGYYELTRNVVFTKLLAEAMGHRAWKVVNVGMPSVSDSANEFAALLKDKTNFEFLDWPTVCSSVPQIRPAWFQSYLQAKELE